MAHRAWVALIAGLATGVFPLTMTALFSPYAAAPPAVCAACLVVLGVLRPPAGAALRWLALLPGTTSIAATARVVVGREDLGRAEGLYGMVEVAMLCVLLAGVIRWFHGALLWTCAPVTAAAAVTWLARFLPDRDPAALAAGLTLWSIPALVAVVVGGYPRMAENRLRRSVSRARDEQRAALERDLHDYVAHDITGMVVQAQAARFAAGDDPERLREALERIELSGQRAMASMDRALELLREGGHGSESALRRPGLDQLGQLVGEFGTIAGGTAQLDMEGDLAALPREVSETLHRLCVEALTNVRRHAPAATSVRLRVAVGPGGVIAEITNDGVVSKAGRRSRGGSGIRTARARVEALGGTVVAGPVRAASGRGGWRIRADLPLRPSGGDGTISRAAPHS